jgi:predicted amidophosphoribosyltransferase
MSRSSTRLRCPVCNARFRGTVTCSRCGADLGPLMTLVARAWHHRLRAARALADGDAESALDHACRSRRLHDTPQARRSELLALLMLEIE